MRYKSAPASGGTARRRLAVTGGFAAVALACSALAGAAPATASEIGPAPAGWNYRFVPATVAETAAAASASSNGVSPRSATFVVTGDAVNYRSGPGTGYPSLGLVNAGQNFDVDHIEGDGATGWAHGNLWGGPTGVWINMAYLRLL